jgi:hypothetical protein
MKRAIRSHHVACSQVGSSLAEVMVTIGIVTGLMGVGILSLDRGYMNMTTAKQNLMNDLRQARMQATLKGAHFRFDAASGAYQIVRLSDDDSDGVWETDSDFTPRTIDLPSGYGISVYSSGATAVAEFDGRGLLVPQSDGSLSIVTVTITSEEGKVESVQIWPSGQVEEAANTQTAAAL